MRMRTLLTKYDTINVLDVSSKKKYKYCKEEKVNQIQQECSIIDWRCSCPGS